MSLPVVYRRKVGRDLSAGFGHFQEVAIGAGAAQVVVWVGHELSDAEVKEKLGAK